MLINIAHLMKQIEMSVVLSQINYLLCPFAHNAAPQRNAVPRGVVRHFAV